MRQDDEFGHYVPLLRRIIILVVVIAAVPVVLWTITAFVRSYVGQPKTPTFHQLAATALINAHANADAAKTDSGRPAVASDQAKPADPPTVEARATANDAGSDNNVSPASLPTAANSAMAAPTGAKADWPNPPSFTSTNAPSGMTASPQPAGADAADAQIAGTPLTGPILLPRKRPRDIGGMRMADVAPSNVPVPRPRPDGAGSSAPSDTSSGGPVEFIQNLFH
jgi:hypothetical protein